MLLAFFLLFVTGASFSPGLEKLAVLQIGPAILAGSFVFLGLMLLLSLLFGRVYCSLLCPLGLTQDLMALMRGKRKYKPIKQIKWLRYGLLLIFIASLASGFLFIYNVLDPYSAFGRMASAIFAPIALALNNFIAWLTSFIGSEAFINKAITFPGWPALTASIGTLALLVFLVLRYGRVWCNYCPLGTVLGLLGSKAFVRVRLDRDKCVSCGLCQKSCKTGCIEINKARIDSSRCVSCLNCVNICPKEALSWSTGPLNGRSEEISNSKRAFLQSLPFLALAPALAQPAQGAQKYQVNRPDIVPEYRSLRKRDNPITPPGSLGLDNFISHCIGCQLCVQACPNEVLVTSLHGTGPLQPSLSYEHGYCRPNCVKCGELCPAGAIKAIDASGKKRIKIGQARIDHNLCIINKDEVQCSACQRVCPNEAISLRAEEDSKFKIPVVDADKCSGCGACEYICPSRPLAAIAVTGLEKHTII